MRELRAVALSEDGGYLVLADPAARPDAEQFRVPVDDRLRAALRGVRRNEVRAESALTPREIQARLRAGETAAEVARAAGIPVERVERYEGPVQAERARVVQEARAALLPKDPGGVPGRPLGEVVDARLKAVQDDPESAQWDAWRRVDGIWLVQLTSETRCARWTWDPVVRRVRPHDDAARSLVAPDTPGDAALQPPQPTLRPIGPALTLVQPPAPDLAPEPAMPARDRWHDEPALPGVFAPEYPEADRGARDAGSSARPATQRAEAFPLPPAPLVPAPPVRTTEPPQPTYQTPPPTPGVGPRPPLAPLPPLPPLPLLPPQAPADVPPTPNTAPPTPPAAGPPAPAPAAAAPPSSLPSMGVVPARRATPPGPTEAAVPSAPAGAGC